MAIETDTNVSTEKKQKLSPAEKLFLIHGRTVSGLRKVIAEAHQAYHTKHLADIEKNLRAGKTAGDKKSGSPTYDAKKDSILETLKDAFPASSAAGLELLKVETGEESQVIALLTGLGAQASTAELNSWVIANKEQLKEEILTIASHSSRLAHTSTNFCLNNVDEFKFNTPFLSSVTVKAATNISSFGNAKFLQVARVLTGTFDYEGKSTNLFFAILQNNTKFLENCGIEAELIADLAVQIKKTPQLEDGRLTQIQWPVGDNTYLSMSPIPSVAVLDELVRRHSYLALTEALPGRIVPTSNLVIGGGNPQNVGAFNTANNGQYPIYRTQLYIASQASAAIAARRIWARSWLNRITKALVDSLEKDISAFDSKSKKRYIAAQAMQAVDQVLPFAYQAKSILEQGVVEFTAELGSRLSNNLVAQWALDAGCEEKQKQVAELVFGQCLEAGANSLISDTTKKELFFESICALLAAKGNTGVAA